MNRFLKILSLTLLAFTFVACGKKAAVEKGSTVTLEYEGKFKKDGKVFDTTEGKKPLVVQVGSGKLIPGFREGLIGMQEGAKKKIEIAPEEAYGKRDDKKMAVVKRDGRFQSLELKEGAVIYATINKNGEQVQYPVTIREFDDKEVTLDYNHPLAGETLVFDVKILKVEPETVGTSTGKIELSPEAAEKSENEPAKELAEPKA
jgi:FKBP-type peptidyl-prolyl cis-trans isomerase SlpA